MQKLASLLAALTLVFAIGCSETEIKTDAGKTDSKTTDTGKPTPDADDKTKTEPAPSSKTDDTKTATPAAKTDQPKTTKTTSPAAPVNPPLIEDDASEEDE